jgi:mycothiol synthase
VADVTVRPATDADDLDALNVGNAGWMGADVIRGLVDAIPETPTTIVVAVLDGEPAGSAVAIGEGVAENRRGPAILSVLPQHRGRGVGTALWRVVREVCTPERVTGILLLADADDALSCAIAVGHGLALGGVHRESELSLPEFRVEPTVVPDVRLAALPADADEPLWRRVLAVHNALVLDAPDAGSGVEPMPYEAFRSLVAEPWQVMLAWHGEDIVGYSSLLVRDAATRQLNTLLTGVTRDFRGRGLSTAIKATHAQLVRDAGWQTIATQNMEGNAAILASNARLGFRQVRSLQDLYVDF